MNDLLTSVRERRAVQQFDPAFSMSRQEIEELLELEALAPSAFNLQLWRFLVIHDSAAKERLLPIANNQQKVVDAAATIAVLGVTEIGRQAQLVYGDAAKKGAAGEDAMHRLVERIETIYDSAPALAREEAVRSASMAAMLLMMAAKEKGFDTCPMGGFDANRLVAEFHIPSGCVPVMLIAVGKAAEPPARARFRLPAEQIAMWC